MTTTMRSKPRPCGRCGKRRRLDPRSGLCVQCKTKGE